MAYLYISEQGSVLGISENRFVLKLSGEVFQSIPVESVEVIQILGNVQISTQCMTRCLLDGIDIIFFSSRGVYHGRLISSHGKNPKRQRKQSICTNDDTFCLTICKSIASAKINNQKTLIRRYNRNQQLDLSKFYQNMKTAIRLIRQCSSVNEVLGHEGFAARLYFKILSKLVNPDFKFSKRSGKGAKDPFNSMLNFGYFLLRNEIYGKIELKALNPFWGFVHQDHENHATLASDLMEEWRATIIDSLVMSLVNGNEITNEDFTSYEGSDNVYLTKEGTKKFILNYEEKMNSKSKYLDYVDYSLTFRKAIELQVGSLAKAIDMNDPNLYHPLKLR